MSRFAALALQVHNPVARMFLALVRIGKKPVNVVPASGGQLIFDAPDFLKHHVAGGLCRAGHWPPFMAVVLAHRLSTVSPANSSSRSLR